MVSLARTAGVTRIGTLRQQGSAKVILPHCGDQPEVVFLNTSGGLTGGDSLTYSVVLGDDVAATATTQTAERAYKSSSGLARVNVDLTVGRDGWIDWLPQETILFDAAKLDRRTQVTLGEGAGCLLLETVVLGRAAMGESLSDVVLRDWREVRRAGKPLMVEPLLLTQSSLTSGVAGLDGARAFASLAMIAPGAGDALAVLRGILDEPGVTGAASVLEGRLMLRLMAADGWPLRRQIARCLGLLRRGRPLPRVWQL